MLAVDVAGDLTVADLKAYIEAETQHPPNTQKLLHNGQPMADDQTLNAYSVAEDDILLCIVESSPSSQTPQQPISLENNPRLNEDVEKVRQQMLNDEVLRQGVNQTYPQLVEVLHDPARFREEMIKVETKRLEDEERRRSELKRLQDDPYNEESQAKILELIRQEAVMENLQSALEHNPEVFGHVTMLFVDVLVNGQPIKAFVDSGAQATIMSPECVERCNMSHLIDRRFQGVAHGVGEAKIIGRVHSAPMKLGDSFLACSFTVMENKGIDMLLGLDMLKRHQGVIDLRNNLLVLGDSQVSFLPESEIPKNFIGGNGNGSTEVPGPSSAAASASAASNAAAAAAARAARNPIAEAQPSPRNASSTYSDETVQNLMGLGFSRDQVVEALQQAGGNPELAAALLFQ
ncbi:DNA damage-inducible protein 1 [Trichomonascus vanleenenianus]|uniref:Ddi1p n=1 Tax=Trichomonascus vanleenenianus TaxID=2268995 RepID=UPI003ECA32D2